MLFHCVNPGLSFAVHGYGQIVDHYFILHLFTSSIGFIGENGLRGDFLAVPPEGFALVSISV
jgi:hypothetical protein